MFISDKLIFIELQKTGCTHITRLLSETIGGKVIGKHNAPHPNDLTEDALFIGSIRNPWEWYISLWAYGCDKKGGLYERATRNRNIHRKNIYKFNEIYKKLTAPHCKWGLDIRKKPAHLLRAFTQEISRKPDTWRHYYTHADDIISFRKWLKLVFNPDYRFDFGEGYGFSSIYKFAGLLTYRYISLFCKNNTMLFSNKGPKNISSLRDFEKSNIYISHFIRNENLEADLINTLNACGIVLTDNQKAHIQNAQKTNTSSRRHGPEYFYDNDTAALVMEREKLIIEKFSYTPPCVRS